MIRLTLSALLLAAPAHAQTVRDCDTAPTDASFVYWPDPTRTFANGAIRFVTLDRVEPANASFSIMVLFPSIEDEGPLYPACASIADAEGFGFAMVSLQDAQATYDPGTGLTVAVPVTIRRNDIASAGTVQVTVNQAMGRVTAR